MPAASVAVGVSSGGGAAPSGTDVPVWRTEKMNRPARSDAVPGSWIASSPQSPARSKLTVARYKPGSCGIVVMNVPSAVTAGLAASAAR